MITQRSFLLLLMLASIMLLAPQSAEACPVCFSAKEGSRQAFLLTTAFLTFFPLGMIGALLFWFRKHIQKKGE